MIYALDRAFFNQGTNAKYEPQIYEDGTVSTLVARGPSAVAYSKRGGQMDKSYCIGNGQVNQPVSETAGTLNCMHEQQAVVQKKGRYIVRRLTPTECARLQGFPDKWGHPDKKESLTDEEYSFWQEVRDTYAEINGKQKKQYSRESMLKWYNKLHTDSSEYKMWGNGIALPNALYVMQGIAKRLKEGADNETD